MTKILPEVTLVSHGRSHDSQSPYCRLCVVEAASLLMGDPEPSLMTRGVHPILRDVMMIMNDQMPDEQRDQYLRPLIPDIAYTDHPDIAKSAGDHTRSQLRLQLVNFVIGVVLPILARVDPANAKIVGALKKIESDADAKAVRVHIEQIRLHTYVHEGRWLSGLRLCGQLLAQNMSPLYPWSRGVAIDSALVIRQASFVDTTVLDQFQELVRSMSHACKVCLRDWRQPPSPTPTTPL